MHLNGVAMQHLSLLKEMRDKVNHGITMGIYRRSPTVACYCLPGCHAAAVCLPAFLSLTQGPASAASLHSVITEH